LSLTTPVIRDEDHVFPGEDWFYYWKTSASLWQSKIQSSGAGRILYVPINWAFHSETGDRYDFAKDKPETDLARLVQDAEAVGKEVIFLFPLSPMPFLPNGGVPTFLARTPSLDTMGKVRAVIDHEGNLNKLYSFFDTRIYQSYSKFTQAFGHYLSSQGVKARLWGIDCGHLSDEGFESFFRDDSQAFKQGFSQYLQGQREQRREEESSSFEDGVLSSFDEYLYREEFTQMIRAIYCDRAKDSLAGPWEGQFQVSFMGASSHDFFQRLAGQDSVYSYAHDILESLSQDTVPSSVLVPSRLKRNLLGKILNQLVTCSYVDHLLDDEIYDDSSGPVFKLKRFFDVYDLTTDVDPDSMGWADLGLWDYLQHSYAWCYADKGPTLYQWEESQNTDRVLFFHGITVDQKLFHEILKSFMSGHQVVINRSGLDPEIVRKFETFFIENNLEVEKVHYHTSIHKASLGDGRLVLFSGDELSDLDQSKTNDFWQRLISTFNLQHFSIKGIEGTFVVWMTRESDHRELNYQEIRRVSIYNPSSYKRKMRLEMIDRFKLIKVVDENLVSFTHSPEEMQIELLPEGSLSLDFGVLP
jgi:hypothetical protein